jgi:hypothetical protein
VKGVIGNGGRRDRHPGALLSTRLLSTQLFGGANGSADVVTVAGVLAAVS